MKQKSSIYLKTTKSGLETFGVLAVPFRTVVGKKDMCPCQMLPRNENYNSYIGCETFSKKEKAVEL